MVSLCPVPCQEMAMSSARGRAQSRGRGRGGSRESYGGGRSNSYGGTEKIRGRTIHGWWI